MNDPAESASCPPTHHGPTLKALAGAITASLGDHADAQGWSLAAMLFYRQVEALAAVDVAYLDAFRALILDRIRPFVHDGEQIEKVLTDTADAYHLYWLAVVPWHAVRGVARHRTEARPRGPFGMILGPIPLGRTGDGDGDGDGDGEGGASS